MKKTILSVFLYTISFIGLAQPDYKSHFAFGGEGMNPQSYFNSYLGVNDIHVTGDEMILICAQADDTTDVDSDVNSDFMLNMLPGQFGPAIIKTDIDGNLIWAINIPGVYSTDYIVVNGSTVDPNNGDIYLTGELWGTVDMNPNSGTNNITCPFSGNVCAFIAKYNTDGLYQWAHAIGGAGSWGVGAQMSETGNVVIAGNNDDGGDLNPGVGVSTSLSTNESDFFIAEFDLSGLFVKGMSWGSTITNDECYASNFFKLNNGNFLLMGWAESGTNIDPYASVTNSANGIVAIELDSGFNFIQGHNILNKPYWFFDNDFTEDNVGNKYFSIRFQGTIDIDPTASVNSVGANGAEDHVILKFTDDYTYEWSRVIGGNPDAYFELHLGTTYDNNLIVFGDYQGSIDIDLNAGTTTLTAWHPTNGRELFAAIYDGNANLIWGESMEIISGSMTGPVMTIQGTTMYISSYLNFTNNLDLAFGTDVEILNYTQNEQTFVATYSVCPPLTAINTNVDVATNLTLTAQQAGDTYQWVDCDNGNAPISGATNQSYTPTQDGNFACEVSLGYCTYLTECKTIFGVGIEETPQPIFSVYPNPSQGNFTIRVKHPDQYAIQIFDVSGKRVESITLISDQIQMTLTSGIYFIEVTNTNGNKSVQKMVIQ